MRNLILALLALLLALPAAADELADLQLANQRLRTEFELARKKQIYFIFDFEQNQVLFRASGLTVARLPISEVRFWGPPPAEKTRTLALKEAKQAPEREKIKVEKEVVETKAPTPPPPPATATSAAEEKPKQFELQALELDDMPTEYRLVFDDGMQVVVRSAQEGLQGTLERLWWNVSRALISDWLFTKGKTYTEVRLIMAEREARLLYWTFNQDAPCLLRRPASQD